MRITYDQNVDALYIRFKEATVTTKHLGEGIAADFDADGRLAGIEVLDAVKRLGDPIVFKRVKLEDVAIARQAVTASTRQMRRNRTSRLKPKASFNRARWGLGYRSVPTGDPGSFARV